MQSAHFSVRCVSLDVAGLSPCIVNVSSYQKNHKMEVEEQTRREVAHEAARK